MGATKGGESSELCPSQGQLANFLPHFFFFGAGGGTQVLVKCSCKWLTPSALC